MRRAPAVVSPLAALLVSLCVCPAAATADCAASRTFVSLPSNGQLPSNPTLYAFVPAYLPTPQARVESDDPRAAIRIEPVSSTDTFKTYALRLKQTTAGKIKVVLSGEKNKDEHGQFAYAEAEYTINPKWRRPQSVSVKVERLTKEVHVWTCSHNQTYNLQPSMQAMAYRVEWAVSQADFKAGKRKSAIFPASVDQFYAPRTAPGEALIKLGHANCLGETFRWPAAMVYVGLAALHPDGSETPAGPVPAEVPWGFGGYLFGAMTPAFYEEVHGKTKQILEH